MDSSAPATELLPIKRVLGRVGISESNVYRGMRAGKFPRPYKVAGRNLWRSDDIQNWIEKNAPRRESDGNSN